MLMSPFGGPYAGQPRSRRRGWADSKSERRCRTPGTPWERVRIGTQRGITHRTPAPKVELGARAARERELSQQQRGLKVPNTGNTLEYVPTTVPLRSITTAVLYLANLVSGSGWCCFVVVSFFSFFFGGGGVAHPWSNRTPKRLHVDRGWAGVFTGLVYYCAAPLASWIGRTTFIPYLFAMAWTARTVGPVTGSATM